jgi:hypothetical protein
MQIIVNGVDNVSSTLGTIQSGFQSLFGLIASNMAFNMLKGEIEDVSQAAQDEQNIMSQVSNSISNAGSKAAISAQGADQLASSLSKIIPQSKDTILQTEQVALKFDKINSTEFPQFIKLAGDISSATGTTMPAAMQMLGRAMENPQYATRLLIANGIQMTSTFKDELKAAQESGDYTKVHADLMTILSGKFQNAGEAAGKDFAGQLEILDNQINEDKVTVGALIDNALTPLITAFTTLVGNNPALVDATIVAGMAFTAVAAAAVVAATAISVFTAAAWAALWPILAIGVAIAILAGSAMYVLAQNTDGVSDATKKMSSIIDPDATSAMGSAGKATQDLSEQLSSLQDNIDKTTRDFQESMADIKKSEDDKISTLRDQIAQENEDYKKSNSQRTSDFQYSMGEMLTAHSDKVATIQQQIDQENKMGQYANQTKISDLKKQLDDENNSYNQSVADKTRTYNQDIDNAKSAYKKKETELEKSLATELAYEKKHSADLAKVNSSDALDAIDKLKQNFADQMKMYDEQKAKIIQNAKDTNAGVEDANLNAIKPLTDIAGSTGNAMGFAFQEGWATALAKSDIKGTNDALNGSSELTQVNWWESLSGFDKLVQDVFNSQAANNAKTSLSDFQGGLLNNPTGNPNISSLTTAANAVTPIINNQFNIPASVSSAQLKSALAPAFSTIKQ